MAPTTTKRKVILCRRLIGVVHTTSDRKSTPCTRIQYKSSDLSEAKPLSFLVWHTVLVVVKRSLCFEVEQGDRESSIKLRIKEDTRTSGLIAGTNPFTPSVLLEQR